MKLVYVFSVISLLVSFLLFKKSDKINSIISSLVYSFCLLFCYNTFVVSIVSFIGIDGSLFVYSIINYIISVLLFGISIFKRDIQKYKMEKKEFVISLIVVFVCLFIGYIRFDGLSTISYESGDSAVHFRHAKFFSKELNLLNDTNSYDTIYETFKGVMPISYINGGLVINLLSGLKDYKVFIGYDIFCFVIYSLLFLTTLFKVFEKKKKNYLYLLVMTLIYTLAFPLNNLLFGFCYMGLGIMVANLLFVTILDFNGDYDNNIIFKLIILFMVSFSLFFSYYLYVPCIYLTMGLYYIYLWRKKKISFSKMIIFGVVTLIIPFIIGFVYFMLPTFIDSSPSNIFTRIALKGYIYNNITPMYLFIVVFTYMIYDKVINKVKLNYFYINIYILSFYIILFLILYFFKKSDIYYFYKLFYLYWVFFMIFLSTKMIKNRKKVYVVFSLILIFMVGVGFFPDNSFSEFLTKINIYNWNAKSLSGYNMLFNESEIELMEESVKYRDVCLNSNGEMPLIGNTLKNRWYYSITNIVPIINHEFGKAHLLDVSTISFNYLDFFENHKCVIYYYEGQVPNYDKGKYKELYSNDMGVILRKK